MFLRSKGKRPSEERGSTEHSSANVGMATERERRSTEASRLNVVYMTSAVFGGLVLSFIAHALIEMAYLRWIEGEGLVAPFYGGCTLTPQIQIGLWVAGAVGGYLFGRWGWRRVYTRN